MTPTRLLIVRHQSPLRVTGDEEVLNAFSAAELRLPRDGIEIDSRPLEESVEGGHWRSSDEFVRRTAAELRDAVGRSAGEVHYFGIAEVPHIIGIGAYFGDETLVHVHDYDRDRDSWSWPSESGSLELTTLALPAELVHQSGEVTLVVELSYPIDQRDVDTAVGSDVLAAVRIRPTTNPVPGLVRSRDDVRVARESVREALAAIARFRPGTTLIHLFIAAPVSVCFAVGQELRLRNGVDVMTYRYRSSDRSEPYKRAILLTGRPLARVSRALSEEERSVAANYRLVLAAALADVRNHATALGSGGAWFAGFEPAAPIQAAGPFPSLAPLRSVVLPDDQFSLTPREQDYALSKDRPRTWAMSDALVLSLAESAGGDETKFRALARLFFYHEYLHDWQDLTKYTAEDVGSFANCLEAIDYMADSYAFLHQLDLAVRLQSLREADARQFLVDQIGLAIASFWAFEPPAPNPEWQERRLRRYLNWYWRRVQLREAPDLTTAIRTLSRRPCIEIAGFKYRTGGGRHFVLVDEPRPGDVPELGVVLEDGRFHRLGSTTDLSIEALMRAFGEADRAAIDRFFNSLFEHLRATAAVFAV
jgi:hypothetical protein